MKRITTFCEPQWIGKSGTGYWSIKVIHEFTPRFLDKVFKKKPYSKEYTYTNLTTYASSFGWRNTNGDEMNPFDDIFSGPGLGKLLGRHLEKHLVRQEMDRIQNRVIKQ